MRHIRDDIRFALRLLARSPGFTAAALVTLALGIGANTTLFSLADALYFRELPVPDASRLVHVFRTNDGKGAFPLSLADYWHYRDETHVFDGLAAHYPTSPLHLVVGEEPIAVTGSVVTANYFDVLRLRPHLGRFFAADEDAVRDRDAVAVVGYGFWQQRLGADPRVIGSTLRVNGRTFTVVGIAPHGFDGALRGVGVSQIWLPSAMFRVGYRYCDAFARDCTVVNLIGRLRPDATFADARAELSVIARQLAAAYPETNKGAGVRVFPARGGFPDQQQTNRAIVGLLLGGVAVLLLIACANVAGLLLARGIARKREIAIRLALGAGRTRIVRQMVVESAVLAGGGGALGLLVATWVKELVGAYYAADYAGRPINFSIDISPPVVAATAALCGVTALLCGLAPALNSTRADVVTALKLTASGARPRGRIRDGLVIGQVALSLVLLIGAGLLVRSAIDIDRGPGVNPERIALLRLRPSLVGYDLAKARAFQHEVVRRLELIPGVEAASPAVNLPLLAYTRDVTLGAGDQTATTGQESRRRLRANYVGRRFFDVLGLPLVAGRDFSAVDSRGAPPETIVDELVAAALGGPSAVVGRIVNVDGRPHEIIGVARAASYLSILEQPHPGLYLSYWQLSGDDFWADSRMHVRVAGDARALLPRLRREIAAIDPNVPINEDYALSDRVRFTFQPVRMVMSLLVGFGAVALILSTVGLYGVVAFMASMRRREIAIRLAIGATRRDIRALVVGHGARLAVAGAVVGLATAFATSRWLASLLYGVTQHDPATFLIVPAILIVIAILASWLPARQALRVDPALTLRQE